MHSQTTSCKLYFLVYVGFFFFARIFHSFYVPSSQRNVFSAEVLCCALLSDVPGFEVAPGPCAGRVKHSRLLRAMLEMYFEYLRRWRCSGPCFPLFDHHQSKTKQDKAAKQSKAKQRKLKLSTEFPVLQFLSTASCPVTGQLWEESGSDFLISHIRYLYVLIRHLWTFSSPGWTTSALSATPCIA